MSRALRDRFDWSLVWLLAAAVIFGLGMLYVASTDVEVSPDALGAGVLSSIIIGLVPALIYWALGAEQIRWRIWRLLVAVLNVLFLIAGAGVYLI